MSRVRGFEQVSSKTDAVLPERSTGKSAGYDFFVYEDVEIEPVFFHVLDILSKSIRNCLTIFSGKEGDAIEMKKVAPTLVKTGIKSYMLDDEYLALYNRSSNPKKVGLILANSVGVVDSDYYNNPENEGEIGFLFYNIFPWKVTLKKGDKLGQGVFMKFLKVDGDTQDAERVGGFGSTGK